MKKLLLILIPILLTGCNYIELNDLAIATSIGVDYDNNTKNFKLTAQVMDTKKKKKGMENDTLVYEAEDKTLSSAINNFFIKNPKNIYFGHLEMCVLGSDAIKYKLDNIFDYFIRESSIKSSCYVLISKEKKANEILNPKNEQEKGFPAEDLKKVLSDSTKKTGLINKITLEEFLSYELKKGIDPTLPTVILKNDKTNSSKTVINGITTIKKNKINKNMNQNQSIAFNTINNNYESTNIIIKYKDNYISFDITNPKTNISAKVKNNKIKTNININLEAHLSETNKKISLTNKNTNEYFMRTINKTFKNYIKELIIYNMENNTDNLGIKNIIYKDNPKMYRKYKNVNPYNMDNINIKIKSNIYVHGNINKGAF